MVICICSKSLKNFHLNKMANGEVHTRGSGARPPWVVEAKRKKCHSRTSFKQKGKSDDAFSRRQSSLIGGVMDCSRINVIFLDIDGTINHLLSPRRAVCPNCVAQLRLIIEQTSCKIVLSSTWRLNTQHKSTLFTYLRAIGVDKGVMIGETRDLGSQNKTRTEEIRDWLLNPNVYEEGVSTLEPWQIQSWVSLDDMNLKGMEAEEEFKSRHITIDPRLGLCKTHDIVKKVVQELSNNDYAKYYQDRMRLGTDSVLKRRTTISREIPRTTLEKIEDLFPKPETIYEDKSSCEETSSDISFAEEVSDVDVGSQFSYESADGDIGTSTTQTRFTGSVDLRSCVQILQDEWTSYGDRNKDSKKYSPKSISHSKTMSCRIIYQSKLSRRGTSLVQYQPSRQESVVSFKLKPELSVHKQKHTEVDNPQWTPRKPNSSKMSFFPASRTNVSSVYRCSTIPSSPSNSMVRVPTISLGLVNKYPKLSVKRSSSSDSFRSMVLLADCTSDEGSTEEEEKIRTEK